MRDRISTFPGRVQLTPVDGQTNVFDLSRNDVPVEIGTPLNKSTLLTDATAALLGLGEDATVDDVLAILARRITYGQEELVSGTSNLETGSIYIQYE